MGPTPYFVAVSLTDSFAVGIVSAVVIVALIGMVVEFLLLKPLYGKDPLLPLLLTFGLSVASPDLIKVIFGLIGKPVSLPGGLERRDHDRPAPSVELPAVHYLLHPRHPHLPLALSEEERPGDDMRAATRDSLMVQVLGTNTSRIWTIGFGIGIGLAALAGAIAVPMMAATPDMGVEMTMVAFVVTVVGGLGSLGGAIVGGLLIGVIVAFTSLIAGEYSNVAIYFCMAVILLIRPRGLFGESGRE